MKALYLKELTELDGVSGDEGRVRDFIKEKIEGKVDSVKVDVLGNLIAFKKGTKSKRKFLLAAHMDEVGFMVTNAEDDGTLSFAPVGARSRAAVGNTSDQGRVPGVIGYKAIHLQRKRDPGVTQIRKSPHKYRRKFKRRGHPKVEIGDYVSFATDFR